MGDSADQAIPKIIQIPVSLVVAGAACQEFITRTV
jgi:hypothetical protein